MLKSKIVKKLTGVNGINSFRWDYIKPFVNFKLNDKKKFNSSQIKKVNSYYREIRRLTGRPSVVYTPKIKRGKNETAKAFKKRFVEKLHTVQDFSQHNYRYPNIRVAFLPTPYPNTRLKFDSSGNIVLSSKYVDETAIKFPSFHKKANLEKWLASPYHYIEDAISSYPANTEFSLRIGKSEFNIPVRKEAAPLFIEQWFYRYMEREGYDLDSSEGKNYLRNLARPIWGLSVYNFKNQKSRVEFLKGRDVYKEKHLKQNPLRKYYQKKKLARG